MTMQNKVYSALLAMDSYNRGYGANVIINGSSLGSIDILTRESLNITDQQYVNWQTAGFYASAYEWNGENVISYRGTNPDFGDLNTFLRSPGFRDVWNGWTLGAGFADASQGQLAIDFYRAVTGDTSIYHTTANPGSLTPTILIGHSLGGGLAGFVASLSGDYSYGYDHMPFGIAAYAQAISDSFEAAVISRGLDLIETARVFSSLTLTAISLVTDALNVSEFLETFQEEFELRSPFLKLEGINVEGEALEYVRNGAAQVVAGLLATPIGTVLGLPELR
jgi:hypothetical protein